MGGARSDDDAQRDVEWQSPRASDDIALIRREALTAAQRDAVRALVAPRVSEFEDLLRDWEGSLSTIEVVWNRTKEAPVGLLSWSGWREVTASWWIAHRGQGLGRRAAELLARVFVEHGARIISPLPILQPHRLASGRMAQHLRRAFAAEQRKALGTRRTPRRAPRMRKAGAEVVSDPVRGGINELVEGWTCTVLLDVRDQALMVHGYTLLVRCPDGALFDFPGNARASGMCFCSPSAVVYEMVARVVAKYDAMRGRPFDREV